MFRKGKFATWFEILPDLILKVLYKENKNKKVKVKLPDTAEKDETTQTPNTRKNRGRGKHNSFTKVVDLSKIYNFCKRIMLGTAAVFELRVFEVWVVSSFSAVSGDLTLTFLFLFSL